MPNHVLDKAQSMMDPNRTEAESMLDQLHSERDEINRMRDETYSAKIKAGTVQKDLQNKLSNVTRAQEDMIERSRTQLRREVEDVRRGLRKIVSQADRDKDLATAQRAIGRIKNQFSDPTWLPIVPPVETENMVEHGRDRKLRAGDQVEIKGLNVNADVVGVSNDGTVDLQMGNARIELKNWQLRRIKGRKIHDAPDSSPPAITLTNSDPEATTDELDIRGVRFHEVADLVTQFVDKSSLQGLHKVRIIHGDGTGTIRKAVREVLATHSLVTGFSPAPQSHGGNGATVVDLT
jgi:DNA mismatch repair protein MutS2